VTLVQQLCGRHMAEHMTSAGVVQDLEHIAEITDGMSARDLRSICEVAERRWVSAIIRGQEEKGSLPPVDAYLRSAAARRASMSNIRPDNLQAIRKLAQHIQ
jgi:hypothetical protein